MSKQLLLSKDVRINLRSNSKSNEDSQNEKLDVVRVMDKKQQSRKSKINISYNTNNNQKQEKKVNKVRHSSYKFNSPFQESNQQQMNDYSDKSKRDHNVQIGNFQNSELDHTLISNYQNNNIIGFIIYMLFLVFILIQIIISSIFVQNQSWNQISSVKTTLLLFLSCQIISKNIIRYFFNNSIVGYSSFSLKQAKKNCIYFVKSDTWRKNYNGNIRIITWIIKNIQYLLGLYMLSIFVSYFLYVILLVYSEPLFLKQYQYYSFNNNSENIYLISSIFWINFGLPFVFNNFYLNRPQQQKTLKLKLFIYISSFCLLLVTLQSPIYLMLGCLKIFHEYLKSFNQKVISIIQEFTQLIILTLTLIISLISIQMQYVNFQNFVMFVQRLIIIIVAMILTRIIGLKYIRYELYKYFYTDSHIIIGYIISTIFIGLFFINNQKYYIFIMIDYISLIILGLLIYLQGKQQLQVRIQETRRTQGY